MSQQQHNPEPVLGKPLEVKVDDRGVERAIRKLRRLTAGEGVLREMKRDGGEAENQQLRVELQEHVKSRLSKHKYPRWVEFCEDLPRNDRGKVDRKALKQRERGS